MGKGTLALILLTGIGVGGLYATKDVDKNIERANRELKQMYRLKEGINDAKKDLEEKTGYSIEEPLELRIQTALMHDSSFMHYKKLEDSLQSMTNSKKYIEAQSRKEAAEKEDQIQWLASFALLPSILTISTILVYYGLRGLRLKRNKDMK